MIAEKLHILRIILISFLILVNAVFSNIWAQQDPLYTQYMFNKQVFNPAYTGTNKEYMCLTILNHNQWGGFGGGEFVGQAPTTTTFSFNAPFQGVFSGIGLYVIDDALGFDYFRTIAITGSARFNFNFGTLHAGLNLGMYEGGTDGKWDPHHDNDQFIPGKESDIKPDLGAGLYLYTDRYYIGLSMQHIIPIKLDWQESEHSLVNHIYLMGGLNLPLPSNRNFIIQPSGILKTDNTKLQFDINCNVLYKNRFWGGLQYRSQDAISILLGMRLLPQLKFGYSYDLTTTEMRQYSNGTHEIMVNYCFKMKITRPEPIPNIIWTPRWL